MVEGEEGEPTALSLFIRGLMAELGINEAELARRSGLAPPTIYAYLGGRARGDRPRQGTFEKLARGLGIDVSELYAVADRSDARGERRIVGYYRQIHNEEDRAEAIEAVRRIAWRGMSGR